MMSLEAPQSRRLPSGYLLIRPLGFQRPYRHEFVAFSGLEYVLGFNELGKWIPRGLSPLWMAVGIRQNVQLVCLTGYRCPCYGVLETRQPASAQQESVCRLHSE
jgi:hypothetical protein